MRIRQFVLHLVVAAAAASVHPALARDAAARVANLTDEPCDFDVAKEYGDRVSCHRLVVPRDYGNPGQGTFGLAVVRVRAQAPNAGQAPVLALHGGPGGRGITFAMGRPRPEFAPGAELIAFDQRGNGRSEPRICDDIPSEMRPAIAAPGDLLTTAWRMNEPYMRCRTRMEQAGVRPEHFGTRITSEDAEQLRRALGISRWNLMAVSYGTVVALDLMAAYPDTIRTVVLDSLVGHASAMAPADYDRPLYEVFSRCAADPACAQQYPTLATDYIAAVASLNRAPLPVTAEMAGASSLELDLNGGELQFLLRRMMRSPRNVASIPRLVQAANARDVAALRPLLGDALGALPEPNALGRPAIMCPEIPAFRSAAAPVHAVESFRLLGVCAAWGPPGPPPRIPTGTQSPALILMGALDPLYEPGVVREVSRALGASAKVVMFPNRTHGVWSPGCAQAMVARFFQTAAAPEVACAGTDPVVRFEMPAGTP